jgi:hypothetical protein
MVDRIEFSKHDNTGILKNQENIHVPNLRSSLFLSAYEIYKGKYFLNFVMLKTCFFTDKKS